MYTGKTLSKHLKDISDKDLKGMDETVADSNAIKFLK